MHVTDEVQSSQNNNKRMGDVVIQDYKNGRTLWIDVTVVNPVLPTYFEAAKKEPFGACVKRQQEKRYKYRTDIEENQKWFEPVVFETFGACSPNSHFIFKDISFAAATRKGSRYKDTLILLAKKLSFDIQKTNAEMLARRMFTNSFQPVQSEDVNSFSFSVEC